MKPALNPNRLLELLVPVLLLLALPSCVRDKCAGISCENGGICSLGQCECQAGWLGERCEIRDSIHNPLILDPGTLSGRVEPASAVAQLVLEGGRYGPIIAGAGEDGTYKFYSVPPGTYLLSAKPATPLYTAPAPRSVRIEERQDVSAELITLQYNASAQTGKIHLDLLYGASYDFSDRQVYAGLQYSSLYVGAKEHPDTGYSFYFSMVRPDSVGAYPGASSPLFMRILHFTGPGTADGRWESSSGPRDEIVSTSIDSTRRRVSGTFKGLLFGRPQVAQDISGTFTDVIF